MKRLLGSRQNPLPIRTFCLFGDFSRDIIPSISKALTGAEIQKPSFRLVLDGR